MNQPDFIEHMKGFSAEASDSERRVVAMIASRITIGRGVYGPLDLENDKRHFALEALEEALDLAVYLGAEAARAVR